MESSEYAKFYYKGKKDGDYYAIVGYKVFHLYDSYFFFTMKTDPSKDSIEITDAWYKGQSIDKPKLDLNQYKKKCINSKATGVRLQKNMGGSIG